MSTLYDYLNAFPTLPKFPTTSGTVKEFTNPNSTPPYAHYSTFAHFATLTECVNAYHSYRDDMMNQMSISKEEATNICREMFDYYAQSGKAIEGAYISINLQTRDKIALMEYGSQYPEPQNPVYILDDRQTSFKMPNMLLIGNGRTGFQGTENTQYFSAARGVEPDGAIIYANCEIFTGKYAGKGENANITLEYNAADDVELYTRIISGSDPYPETLDLTKNRDLTYGVAQFATLDIVEEKNFDLGIGEPGGNFMHGVVFFDNPDENAAVFELIFQENNNPNLPPNPTPEGKPSLKLYEQPSFSINLKDITNERIHLNNGTRTISRQIGDKY